MSDILSFFLVPTTPKGKTIVQSLLAQGSTFSKMLHGELFDDIDHLFWAAAPTKNPVGCLLELALKPEELPMEALLRVENAAERLDAHGVSVFIFSTTSSVPTEWLQTPLISNYHFFDFSKMDDGAFERCEQGIILHLHFARFIEESDVQVFEPSAIKFLRSRQRLEQECFVMSQAEASPDRSKYFVKLLARHTCPDFHAIETERFDCTIDDLLEAKTTTFSASLPYYILNHILEALHFLHDWSDLGIHTFGDFRQRIGLSLRQFIPESVYFRHFRHVAKESLDAIPFQIIHCDMKPGNFLLRINDSARQKIENGKGEISPDEIPEVKMFDFDLCRYGQPTPGSSGSSSGPTLTGTFGYTAPELFLTKASANEEEVVLERQITPMVDFYAVGTLFFELLTRQPLVSRKLLQVEDDEYYSTLMTFHQSNEYESKLNHIESEKDREFIRACTQPRQSLREKALKTLLRSKKDTETVTAIDFKNYYTIR